MEFSKPRGTRDFLPEEIARRRKVEKAIRETFERFGYAEVQTPTFETLELITKKSGEEIRERLYYFKDKKGRKLALRPELTAPAMRLYVSALKFTPKPVKIYYSGNCFRYERPQSGRFREFWQAGVELIGSGYPEAEAEIIALAIDALEATGLKNFELHIGNLGILRRILQEGGVNEEEQDKVMGIIDKRDEKGLKEELIKLKIPEENKKILLRTIELVGEESNVLKEARMLLKGKRLAIEELKKFTKTLDAVKTFGLEDYKLNLGIARGLDYYSGMVFEIYAPDLGAEKQICGGGSYSLVEAFGGQTTPTCGFAFGFDRIILALEAQGYDFGDYEKTRVLVVPTGKELLKDAIRISNVIRKETSCEAELMRRKLSKALSYANSKGISYVIIIGERELKEGKILLKDMNTGEQKTMKVEEALKCMKG